MSSIKGLLVPVIIAIAIVFSLSSVKGEHFCNLKIHADESNEGRDISYLITSLIKDTPTHGYNQHLSINGYYGAAACNGEISKDDCDDCLEFANLALFKSCRNNDGGQIKLVDCRLRFERYEIPDW